jgi:plastocyanin
MVSLGLLLSITVAACGTEQEKIEPTVTRVDAANAPATYTPTVEGQAPATPAPGEEPTEAPTSANGGRNGGGATTVEVDMVDIAFKETTLEIPANTDVTFHIVNSGALQHEFAIEGHDDLVSGLLNAGESKDIVINLPPGTYTYHCPVPGHTEAGMKGTLTVK